jgi:hypothetical protein
VTSQKGDRGAQSEGDRGFQVNGVKRKIGVLRQGGERVG